MGAWTRGRVNRPNFFLLLDKSRILSKIVSVLRSASVERFNVFRMRDFSSAWCAVRNIVQTNKMSKIYMFRVLEANNLPQKRKLKMIAMKRVVNVKCVYIIFIH